MDLNGSIAIVTGGSRGIGRQLALDLAGHGAHVVLAARDEAHLDDAVEAIRRSGGSANGLRCDVADPSQVQHLIDGVESEYKKIDLLATCAAIGPPANVADCDLEGLASVVNVNLLGTMWCCRAVLPTMRRQHRGQIITFTSHTSHVPLPGAAAYSGTKAGVAAFSEALHAEVRLRWDSRLHRVSGNRCRYRTCQSGHRSAGSAAEVGVRNCRRGIGCCHQGP